MIFIVSSSAAERSAFVSLCESRGWVSLECESLRAARKALRQVRPRAMLTRHKLSDGYSDDLLIDLAASGLLPAIKVIVVLGSGVASSQAARQVKLGADSVLRDPVRTEVLVEYLARYRGARIPAAKKNPSPPTKTFRFAGGLVHPIERRLQCGRRNAGLTPREVQLAELLFESAGDVVTYATLFSEVLGSKFRGETSNMRVLLGKLDASYRSVGLGLREFIEVIPKMGYRYMPPVSVHSPREPDVERASAA